MFFLDTTIVFNDSTPCVVVRTNTHQYTFCFRRQVCPQNQRSAFCTTKFDALKICQQDKMNANLLTIENDAEYALINDIITLYSDQTLLDRNDTLKSKYVARAQWMWIDGSKGLNDIYRWNLSGQGLANIDDKYWCDMNGSCLGGKGRDHVVLNIVCQSEGNDTQICLASRRQSEPGPFICKRRLTDNEGKISLFYEYKRKQLRELIFLESISKFVYLKDIKNKFPLTLMSTVDEKSKLFLFQLSRM